MSLHVRYDRARKGGQVNGAGRCNFVIEKGTKWAPSITSWTNEAGTAIVPSSYSAAAFTVFDTDGTTLVSLTSGSGITLGATGIDLLLTPTQTGDLTVGTYEYQMTVTGGDTYPFELLRGVVTVEDVP